MAAAAEEDVLVRGCLDAGAHRGEHGDTEAGLDVEYLQTVRAGQRRLGPCDGAGHPCVDDGRDEDGHEGQGQLPEPAGDLQAPGQASRLQRTGERGRQE